MPAFRHLPVTSLIDVTHNFEQIESERATELRGLGSSAAVGAWTTLTLAEALEFNAAGYTPAVRTEQGGADARLRGILKTKVGKELAAEATIATLTAPFRPTKTVLMSTITVGGTATWVSVASTGVLNCKSALPAGTELALDGITFSLT